MLADFWNIFQTIFCDSFLTTPANQFHCAAIMIFFFLDKPAEVPLMIDDDLLCWAFPKNSI